MRNSKAPPLTLFIALAIWFLLGCNLLAPQPTPTPTYTGTPQPTSTAPPTLTPTLTFTPAPTLTPTHTAPPAPSPTPTLAATSTPYQEGDLLIYEKPNEGFAIGLPSTWTPVDLDAETLDAAFDALKKSNPDMALMLSNQAKALATAGIKFFAFDFEPKALAKGFAPNVNVLRQTLPVVISLDDYVQINIAQLENVPSVVKPIKHKRVTLKAGEAEELHLQLKLSTPSGKPLTIATTLYLFLKDKTAYVITCGTISDLAVQYAPIFTEIGKSFRLLSK